VPLYAEELTKTLLDSGALELVGDTFRLTRPLPSPSQFRSRSTIPDGRLDRLSDVKDVALLASTIGRVFHHDLLAAVSMLDEATPGTLSSSWSRPS
jgi:predicted ATPase